MLQISHRAWAKYRRTLCATLSSAALLAGATHPAVAQPAPPVDPATVDPATVDPAPAGPSTNPADYDHGMYPFGIQEPDVTDARLPLYPGLEWTKYVWYESFNDSSGYPYLASNEPQETNPEYPNGMDHLPKATIDMDPLVLQRLQYYMFVDGHKIRQINAYSPSMGRTIPLIWITPNDTSQPRPTVYMLGGGDGGEGADNWISRGNALSFLGKQNVNVILLGLGARSYYADWEQENPYLGGKQKWETFLTHELPGPLEAAIGANGKRSIIGMSMSGLTVLNYAAHKPNFYDSVASLSGCGLSNNWFGRRALAETIYQAAGSPEMMWGKPNSPNSRYNDPALNARMLAQQKNLYIYSATGLLARNEFEGPNKPETEVQFGDRLNYGFGIEIGTNYCNHVLRTRLANVNAQHVTWDMPPTGTHSWDAWNDAVVRFWPLMARSFGMDAGPLPEYSADLSSGSSGSSDATGSSAIGSSGSSDGSSTGSSLSSLSSFGGFSSSGQGYLPFSSELAGAVGRPTWTSMSAESSDPSETGSGAALFGPEALPEAFSSPGSSKFGQVIEDTKGY